MSKYFVHPSTFLVSGPTGCGKTRFVARVILENMIQPQPNKIIWIYSEWQALYDQIREQRPEIEFVQGLTEGIYNSLNSQYRNLIILDDQMGSAGNSKLLAKLFTQVSHHRNLPVIYIVQNFFDQTKEHRTISLNTQYVILFKNPRDKGQLSVLSRAMYGAKSGNFLVDVFNDATRGPYGYLVLDFRPESEDETRLRTKIFPGEQTDIYVRKV